MPTKTVYDCTTGETSEVEMTGAELIAHEALLAMPDPEEAALAEREEIAQGLEQAAKKNDIKGMADLVARALRRGLA